MTQQSTSPQPSIRPLKVAIVHDWLIGGGAELVVEQLHRLYPSAPIYTSYATREWRDRLDGQVRTGWLQYLGSIRKFIPVLRILWFTRLKFDGYDMVISSSGAEAKGIKVPAGTIHINYCHAPTHYYWSRYEEYLKHPGFGPLDGIARLGLRLLVAPLRKWDYAAAQRPDYMIANSTYTQSQIQEYYGRNGTVIYPPVYMERFQKPANQKRPRRGFLIAGRQTPYKRFDLAVQAATKYDLPLTVVGDGPDHKRLRKLAGPTVTFLGRVSDEVMEEEFASSLAFVFPGIDDFGITPVEAMASGTPVIAYKAGGALDYVLPGKSGEFFEQPTPESLGHALQAFRPERYSNPSIAVFADRFSVSQFQHKLSRYIHEVLKAKASAIADRTADAA